MEKARTFRASSYRISKDKEMKQEISERVMRKAICRPRKISPRIGSQLLRQISKLRREEGHFTVKRLMKQAGLNNKEVTIHTGLRFLRSKGYKYIQPCQKGLLTGSDLRKRFQFAKEMKEYNYNVWTEKIAIFLDAVLCTCLTPQSKHVLVEGVYGERKARDYPTGALPKLLTVASVAELQSLSLQLPTSKG